MNGALATVTSNDFVNGTQIMIRSFLNTNEWFNGDIIIFHTQELSCDARAFLSSLGPRIQLRLPSPLIAQRIEGIFAHSPNSETTKLRFQSLNCFSLRGYSEILFCDSDILFLADISELLNASGEFVAAPDGANSMGKARDRASFEIIEKNSENRLQSTFNSGLFLVRNGLLNDETERLVLQELTEEKWRATQTQHTDQAVLNRIFADQATLVSSVYNYPLRHLSTLRNLNSITPKRAKALHFNLPLRPWNPRSSDLSDSVDTDLREAYLKWHEEAAKWPRYNSPKTNPSLPKPFRGSRYDLNHLIDKHIFILSPNNSGSTFLKNALSLSRKTWNLEREGQHTFGFQGPNPSKHNNPLLWASDPKLLQSLRNPSNYDWKKTKKAWYFQAFAQDPNANIFVEKSPPFLLLAKSLAENFKNPHFIFLSRNPFAVAEGILRRRSKDFPNRSIAIEQTALHITTCLSIQKSNIEAFRTNALHFTYEQLCDQTDAIAQKLSDLAPELSDLDLNQVIPVKSLYAEKPRNMNSEQIARLSDHDLAALSKCFAPHVRLFDFFGYSPYTTSPFS
ncbi:glycosyltransferase [Pelagicoccus sp. SDUM812003]|uniref:glycosyltransferase n=1 Tax=Pelagicoccus sp. SDUM812003 TaxID=3041267 RepID=UPI0028101503|nr:glycosyltransferase [Pelagicoccus sp. SDUM812003]MDQ8205648.1 glycosyltransferase [Pelagicoccus sp. SDUM812003]